MKQPSRGFLIVMAILLLSIGFIAGAGLASFAGGSSALSDRRYLAVGNIHALGNGIELLESGREAEAFAVLRDAFLNSCEEFDTVQSNLDDTRYYAAQAAAFRPLRDRLQRQKDEANANSRK